MKRSVVLLAGLLASAPMWAQTAKRAAAPPAPKKEMAVPFKAGEVLEFDIGWSSYLTAGTAVVSVKEKKPSYNSVAYYVVAEGQPTPLLSKLYTLYYKADVLMDVFTLLPQRAGVYSEEGQRHQMKVTTFNNAARKATFEHVSAKSGKREFSVPAFTQDALSAIYVMRALPLKVGVKETIPVTTGGRSYSAQVSVVGIEALETGAGPYQAFRLRTTLSDEKGQPSGRPIHLWISDTPSRVPVKLQSELSVGSFILTLSQAQLGQ